MKYYGIDNTTLWIADENWNIVKTVTPVFKKGKYTDEAQKVVDEIGYDEFHKNRHTCDVERAKFRKNLREQLSGNGHSDYTDEEWNTIMKKHLENLNNQ